MRSAGLAASIGSRVCSMIAGSLCGLHVEHVVDASADLYQSAAAKAVIREWPLWGPTSDSS